MLKSLAHPHTHPHTHSLFHTCTQQFDIDTYRHIQTYARHIDFNFVAEFSSSSSSSSFFSFLFFFFFFTLAPMGNTKRKSSDLRVSSQHEHAAANLANGYSSDIPSTLPWSYDDIDMHIKVAAVRYFRIDDIKRLFSFPYTGICGICGSQLISIN